MRIVSTRAWCFSALSAVLLALPFPLAGPVPSWRRLFCWVALTPLLYALRLPGRDGRTVTARSAALLGYLCGVLWFAMNCYWVYQTMHLYGGLPEVAAAGILLLFSLYLGLYFALFAGIFSLAQEHLGSVTALSLSPVLWVAVELARNQITGFPWDLLGYTQVDNLFLTGMAPVTGVMGISLVVAAINALWLTRLPKLAGFKSYLPQLGAVVIVVGVTIFGHPLPEGFLITAPAGPQHTAVLLQDNLNVGAMRMREGEETREAMFNSFADLSLHPSISPRRYPGVELPAPEGMSPDLILWPEAPTEFVASDPAFRAVSGGLARTAHAALVSDSVSNRDDDGKPVNHVSASFFTADGQFAGRYDKMHLVPFGEYVPFHQIFFFAGHLLDGLDFVPGKTRNLFVTNGHRYGVFICYESVFGDEVREFAKSGADVLVNLTDDGWYGDTSAPWEHLDMARMRAIENHRWLLRDTNTGLTAAISPDGVIHEALPRHIRGAQLVHFDYLNDVTIYTRFGDWLGLLCEVVTLSALVFGAVKSGFSSKELRSAKTESA